MTNEDELKWIDQGSKQAFEAVLGFVQGRLNIRREDLQDSGEPMSRVSLAAFDLATRPRVPTPPIAEQAPGFGIRRDPTNCSHSWIVPMADYLTEAVQWCQACGSLLTLKGVLAPASAIPPQAGGYPEGNVSV